MPTAWAFLLTATVLAAFGSMLLTSNRDAERARSHHRERLAERYPPAVWMVTTCSGRIEGKGPHRSRSIIVACVSPAGIETSIHPGWGQSNSITLKAGSSPPLSVRTRLVGPWLEERSSGMRLAIPSDDMGRFVYLLGQNGFQVLNHHG